MYGQQVLYFFFDYFSLERSYSSLLHQFTLLMALVYSPSKVMLVVRPVPTFSMLFLVVHDFRFFMDSSQVTSSWRCLGSYSECDLSNIICC